MKIGGVDRMYMLNGRNKNEHKKKIVNTPTQ